jgi:hypothetical protein
MLGPGRPSLATERGPSGSSVGPGGPGVGSGFGAATAGPQMPQAIHTAGVSACAFIRLWWLEPTLKRAVVLPSFGALIVGHKPHICERKGILSHERGTMCVRGERLLAYAMEGEGGVLCVVAVRVHEHS